MLSQAQITDVDQAATSKQARRCTPESMFIENRWICPCLPYIGCVNEMSMAAIRPNSVGCPARKRWAPQIDQCPVEKKKSFDTLAIHRPVAIIQSETKKTTSKHVSKNTARGVRNEESQLRAELIGGEGALRQHLDRTFGQHSEPSPRMYASVEEGRRQPSGSSKSSPRSRYNSTAPHHILRM